VAETRLINFYHMNWAILPTAHVIIMQNSKGADFMQPLILIYGYRKKHLCFFSIIVH